MTFARYRDICRLVIATLVKLDPKAVRPRRLSGVRRAGLPPVQSKVDLHWITENNLFRYVHVARVRWRTRRDVGAGEILLLQQIKERVGAHKALFFTNTRFSERALALADEAGIALLILRPSAAAYRVDATRPARFFAAFAEVAQRSTAYMLREVRDGLLPIMTKDEANRFVNLAGYKLWIARAATDGRLNDRGNRCRLAGLFPGMAGLLRAHAQAITNQPVAPKLKKRKP